MAAAVATKATHLVTDNTRDFPVRSRPDGLIVQGPQAFLLAQLSLQPDPVLAAPEHEPPAPAAPAHARATRRANGRQ